MPMSASEIEKRIKAAIPDAVVELRDLAGDDNHWAATVISEQFRGKTRVQQHQLVYRALGERMREEIHALSMRTLTPEEWRR